MIELAGKIILRRPSIDDVCDLLSVKNNKDAAKLLGGFRQSDYCAKDIEQWIEYHNNAPAEVVYVIYDIELKAVVGHAGLYQIDERVKKAEFGILIGNDACRGKGYGSLVLEYMLRVAFCDLNLNRVELTLLKENQVAKSLYHKFGFVVEGTQRQAQFKNDRYYDVVMMSLLRDEYESR